jgi:uncharacterized phosphosugar-binding protein
MTRHQPLNDAAPAGSRRLLELVIAHLSRVEREQAGVLDQAARLCWEAVRGGGLIHVGGAGHSLALVLETFYRAGGLAAVNPIWHPGLLPLFGGATSTHLERVPGFGRELVARASPRSPDVLVVFSNSGINAVPVDMALAGHDAGIPVVAVVSRDHAAAVASRHPSGRKLPDVADVVVDTGIPPGDAVYQPGGGQPAVAPLSTIVGAYIWDALLVRLSYLARRAGVALPIWESANLPAEGRGGLDLMARFRPRVPAL